MYEFKLIIQFYNKDRKVRRVEKLINGTGYDVTEYLDKFYGDNLYFAICLYKKDKDWVFYSEYMPKDVI